MLSNYYTLAGIAADLHARIRGKRIREAYTQEKNELAITFEGMAEGLIMSCSPEVNTLYLHPRLARSRTNSADVLKTIVGKSAHLVSIRTMDRVVGFKLDDDLTLYAQFFGSKANVLLVDNEHRIVDAFKDRRTVTGTMCSPAGGELVHDVTIIRSMIEQTPTQPVITLLKRASPVLGSTLANEILFRSGLSISTKAQEVNGKQIEQLESSYSAVLTELARPKPRIYISREPPHPPYRFSLIKLEHCDEFEERMFEDIHDAIRFFVSRLKASGTIKSYSGSILGSLQQHHAKLTRTITAVEQDLAGSERAEEYEQYANLLMANLNFIKKGMKSIDLLNGGERITISLDSRLTPIQNAQRYFEKVKKSRLAHEQSRGRLVELKAKLGLAEELRAEAETIHTKEELKTFMTDRTEELEQFGIGEKAKEREHLPFRIFNVDGGFEVWAGKSSRNNDELTMKHAKPNDLWFHARGASGSHVILRTNSGKGEPGKKAKAQAASIAAYYSKMKNATMVPVAMTEKKYVRKPKGAPPGTVVLEREKVVFAEPALPDGKPAND